MSKAFKVLLTGLDGCGKATQAARLKNWAEWKGLNPALFDYPIYDSPTGKEIAEVLAGKQHRGVYTMSELYAANRKENIGEVWQAEAEGRFIIFNRGVECNKAYQAARMASKTHLGDPEHLLDYIDRMEYEVNKFPRPDVVIYYMAPVDVTMQLAAKRAEPDVYERNRAFLEAVQRQYLRLWQRANKDPNGPDWYVLDLSSALRMPSELGVEVIYNQTVSCVLSSMTERSL